MDLCWEEIIAQLAYQNLGPLRLINHNFNAYLHGRSFWTRRIQEEFHLKRYGSREEYLRLRVWYECTNTRSLPLFRLAIDRRDQELTKRFITIIDHFAFASLALAPIITQVAELGRISTVKSFLTSTRYRSDRVKAVIEGGVKGNQSELLSGLKEFDRRYVLQAIQVAIQADKPDLVSNLIASLGNSARLTDKEIDILARLQDERRV